MPVNLDMPARKAGQTSGGASAAPVHGGAAVDAAAIVRVAVAPDGRIRVPHASSDVQSVQIADVDLLLQMRNGTWVLVPQGALDALSAQPPQIQFNDGFSSTGELIKHAGKTASVHTGTVRVITDLLTVDPDLRGADSPAASVEDLPRPAPDLHVSAAGPAAGVSKLASALSASGAGTGVGPGEVPEVIHAPVTVVPPEFKQGRRVESLDKLQVGIPSSSAQMYVDSAYKVTPSGRSDSPVGSLDSSAAAQATRESVHGTSGSDVIDHNAAHAAVGWDAKVLHLSFPNFTVIKTIDVTLPSLAFGVSLEGGHAVQDANTPGLWHLTFDTSTSSSTSAAYSEGEWVARSGLDLKISYELAADGDNSKLDFPMEVTVHGDAGNFGFEVTRDYTLSRRVATTASDFEVFGVDGSPIYVLPSHGIGYDIDAGEGNDEVHAGSGDDHVLGGAGDDRLYGDAGNDVLEGGTGADVLVGGAGTDTASYEHAASGVVASLDARFADRATGDAAGDQFDGVENLVGSAFDDVLIGDSGANLLQGGDGNDVLVGGAGADTLDGGAGINTAGYETSFAGVTAVLGTAPDDVTVSGDAVGDTYVSIQNLTGSAYADHLIGDDQDNRLDGGAGNDELEGRAGADALVGGDGQDTASYAHADTGVTVSLTAGLVTATGDAAGDTFDGIENLRGSSGSDLLIGDAQANVLSGGDGNDTLEGLGGADTLDGQGGYNIASYEHAQSGVQASLVAGLITQTGDAAGDRYLSISGLTGSAFDDVLIGNAQSNVLNGGAGNDVLEGGGLGDALQGGDGSDTVSYAHAGSAVTATLTTGLLVPIGDASGDTYDSIENLEGSAYDDTLVGDAGDNTLSGGAGNDVLEGLGGADHLIGGAGNDTASYETATTGVAVSLTPGTVVQTGDAAGDVLEGIENLIGSAHDDVLVGDAGVNVLRGGLGNDVLEGRGGADVLMGEGGDNTASYEHATSGVQASLSPGLITATGDAAGDVFYGIENLRGSDQNDLLVGDNNDNRLEGGAGDDVLEGLVGADALIGGGGTDTASYAHAYGAVTATLTQGLAGVVTQGDAAGDTYDGIVNLSGGQFSDVLIGSADANTLSGANGDDVLEGLAGADVLDGGQGSDTASYAHAANGLTASLDAQVASTGDAAGDTYVSIENLTGSGHDDRLVGNSGSNTLDGGAGDDLLEGGGGADVLIGGTGSDTVSYAHAGVGVVATMTSGLGDVTTSGDAQGDTFSSVENLQGSGFADVLIGNSEANRLEGGAGDDVLEGLGGADTLVGGTGTNTASYAHAGTGVVASLTLGLVTTTGDGAGDTFVDIQNLTGSESADTLIGDAGDNTLSGNAGNDTLEGLAGADRLIGGAGQDVASYAHSTGALTASLDGSLAATGDAAGDVYDSIEGLEGGSGADHLRGDAGNNTLIGNGGDDLLEGGIGGDELVGGDGTDTASYDHAAQGVAASLTSGLILSIGEAAGDTFTSVENLTGSAYDDTLIGASGGNVLTGGAGNDTLEGLGGADVLTGGAGSDTASYAHAGSAVQASLTAGWLTATGDAAGDSFDSIENLTGSDFADVLAGDAGANVISGGTGDDLLEGGAGADSLIGGAGDNTASYAHATTGVTASLIGLVSGTGDAAGDTYSGIENLLGSALADTLIGDNQDNVLNGGAGDDLLEGFGGADRLIGGGGSDTASYEHSFNAIVASLTSGLSDVTTSGDAVGDVFVGIANLRGSNLGDLLVGDAGNNRIEGLSGDDVLEGLGGADALVGGTGSNTVTYVHSSTAVLASLTAGSFDFGGGTVTALQSGSQVIMGGASGVSIGDALGDAFDGIQNLTGSSYDDVLLGDGAVNVLSGGAGNDTLEGYGGADVLVGGVGSDTASYAHAAAAVQASLTVNLSGFVNTGDAAGDTYSGIENLSGSTSADTLIGDAAANVLTGNGGADRLEGMGGADTLVGTAGSGVTASYEHAQTGVTAALTAGLAGVTATGDAAGDNYVNIANLSGSGASDVLIGDAGANVLAGNDGDDVLEGLGGADVLNGGNGNDVASYAHASAGIVLALNGSFTATGDAAGDTLVSIEGIVGTSYDDVLVGDASVNTLSGGAGNDLLEGMGGADAFDGGGGTDTVTYAHSSTSVAASLIAGQVVAAGDAAGDTFVSVESLIGSVYADTLVGDSGSNVITGNGGADEIEGGAGADTLTAAAGSGSTLSFAHASAGVTFALDASLTATGDAAGDVVSGFSNLRGSALADTLVGDANDNVVSGGAGNDTLTGNAGDDTLNGEDGNDVLYGGLGTDEINGGAGDDLVYVSSGIDNLDGGTGTDTLDAAKLASEGYRVSSFNLATGQLTLYNNSTGTSYIEQAINFENAVGTSAYQETFYSGATSNVFTGVGTNDQISYYSSYIYSGSIAPGTGLSTSTKNDGVMVDMVNHVATSLNGSYAGAGGTDTFTGIYNVYGTRWGDDVLLGDANNNWLGGYRGRDYIDGGAGSDTWNIDNDGTGPLNGASYILASLTPLVGVTDQAAATAYGLSSSYVSTISTTTISMTGLPTVTWGTTDDFVVNVENIYGTSFNDWLIGSGTANQMYGNTGNDVLEGLAGGDSIDGGGGTDTATYQHASAGVVASLTVLSGSLNSVTFSSSSFNSNSGVKMTGANAGDANGDVLTSTIENLTGSDYADVLVGSSGVNVLTGGLGDDRLEGLGGADTLDGGSGTDLASYAYASTGTTVSLLTPSLNSGDAANDTYISIEGLVGSAYNDTLTGDNNDNVIIADKGNDTVSGLIGNDTFTVSNASANMVASLSGGAGTDTVTIGGLVAGTSTTSNTLNTLVSHMNTVEVLDIRSDNLASTVYLGSGTTSAATYVQNLVGNGTSSELTILANKSSTVDALSLTLGTGETVTSAVSGVNTDYTIHNSLGSTIAVIHWQGG